MQGLQLNIETARPKDIVLSQHQKGKQIGATACTQSEYRPLNLEA